MNESPTEDGFALQMRIFRSHRGDGIAALIQVAPRAGADAVVSYSLSGVQVSREDFLAAVALGAGR